MNLYVSNLDFKVKEEDLRQLFGQHGTVSTAKIINDHSTGYSRGFAFVEMPNDGEAQNAMEALNTSELHSRPMSVKLARPKEDKFKKVFTRKETDTKDFNL